jgi:peptide/nickel transport system substrate-binding protein
VAICPNVGWPKDFADAQTFLVPTFDGDRILPAGNSDWSQLDDPALNERMDQASLVAGLPRHAHAFWAGVDEQITRLAPASPYLWPEQANPRSENVIGTIDHDIAVWSLAHMRLR